MTTDMLNLSLLAAVKNAGKSLAGYWKLGLLLFAAWLLLFALAFLCRQLLREFSGSERLKNGRVFLTGLLEGFAYTLLRLPKILLALVLLFVLQLLFQTGSGFKHYLEAEQRIKELSAVAKNLSRMDDIARIRVLDDKLQTPKGTLAKKYQIDVLSLSGQVLASQTVAMEGEEIFLDSVNVNFDYAEIESGKKRNIAFPYRVYTEKIPPAYGVLLTCMYNGNQLPLLFLLTDEEVYGIEKERYNQRVKEFAGLLAAEKAGERAALGIRSFNGSAVHIRLAKGETALVRVEGSGGISLHKEAF